MSIISIQTLKDNHLIVFYNNIGLMDSFTPKLLFTNHFRCKHQILGAKGDFKCKAQIKENY